MNGTLIREKREAKKLSQAALGAAIGLDQASISRLESGKQVDVRGSILKRLAAALDVTDDALLAEPAPAEPSAA